MKRTSFMGRIAALAALLTFTTIGCSDDDKNPMSGNTAPTMDIVETAQANGNFTTLLAAAQAAGLVDALKGDGPLTVFAPTDAAFAMLPAGALDALLADPDALTATLLYHVVADEVTASEVISLTSAPTLNGANLSISITGDNKVKINNAIVTVTDIKAKNGIIHVIDAVMLPPTASSPALSAGAAGYTFGGGWIAEAIRDGKLKWLTSRLSLYTVAQLTGLPTLTTAVKAAGLRTTLITGGPFTLFGPTEEAFAALPAGTVASLLQNPTVLQDILLYHVVPAKVTSAQVVTLTEATMANGDKVSITVNGGVKVNDANVIVVDIPARNGVLHLIDGVLIPE